MYKKLYILMMNNILSKLFTSTAKVELLSLICLHKQAQSLRYLSRVSNIPLRSTQLALKSLLREGVLIKESEGNQTLYTMNKEYFAYNLISNVFEMEQSLLLKLKAETLGAKAMDVLEFSSEQTAAFAK